MREHRTVASRYVRKECSNVSRHSTTAGLQQFSSRPEAPAGRQWAARHSGGAKRDTQRASGQPAVSPAAMGQPANEARLQSFAIVNNCDLDHLEKTQVSLAIFPDLGRESFAAMCRTDTHEQLIIADKSDMKLLQTIGTPEREGADATHFNRPTFIDWLPDGTFFVSDGYTGTRVAKFDKNGRFLMDWGIKGNPNSARTSAPIIWARIPIFRRSKSR